MRLAFLLLALARLAHTDGHTDSDEDVWFRSSDDDEPAPPLRFTLSPGLGARAGAPFQKQPCLMIVSGSCKQIHASAVAAFEDNTESDLDGTLTGTLSENCDTEAPMCFDLVFKKPGLHFLSFEGDGDASSRITQEVFVEEAPMTFSFIIQTRGDERIPVIEETVRAIDGLGIPESDYEIIVIGTTYEGAQLLRAPKLHRKMMVIATDVPFTTKKNLGADLATMENLVIMHDHIVPSPNFYAGFLEYGNNFDVVGVMSRQPGGCVAPSIRVCPEEFPEDFQNQTFPSLTKEAKGSRLPIFNHRWWEDRGPKPADDFMKKKWLNQNIYAFFRRSLFPTLRISTLFGPYVNITGFILIAKRSFFLRFPMPENWDWDRMEDIWWTRQASRFATLKINKFSSVEMTKYKGGCHPISEKEIAYFSQFGMLYW